MSLFHIVIKYGRVVLVLLSSPRRQRVIVNVNGRSHLDVAMHPLAGVEIGI